MVWLWLLPYSGGGLKVSPPKKPETWSEGHGALGGGLGGAWAGVKRWYLKVMRLILTALFNELRNVLRDALQSCVFCQ